MNILNAVINSTYTKYPIYNNEASFQETKPSNNNIEKKSSKKVLASSLAGSVIGIAAAVGGVYAMAKKGSPTASIKNLRYEEKDILLIGAGSVLGGLSGGLLADKNKKNVKPKLREASQMFFGSLVCPLGFLAVTERLLDKSGFKLPKINSGSAFAKKANVLLSALPKIAVTAGSLIAGMEIGNAIMNKINNKIFKEEVKHDVHPSDYLVHTDDACVAASLLLKDSKTFASVTSKLLPASFILSGVKTGIQKAD